MKAYLPKPATIQLKRAKKGHFLHPETQKYTRRVKRRKEIERAKIKEEREGEKLSKMAALLVLYLSTLDNNNKIPA